MSDEMAEKTEQEKKAQEEAQAKAQEELNNRLWRGEVVLDPVTGQVAVTYSENVTKQYQADAIWAARERQDKMNSDARVLRAELDRRDAGKVKKGLFGAR